MNQKSLDKQKPKELECWEKEFDKQFGKYTFCEDNSGGIMVWGSDKPKEMLKDFIKQTLTQQRTELLEEIIDILDNIDTGMYVDDEWVSNSEELTELRKSLKKL